MASLLNKQNRHDTNEKKHEISLDIIDVEKLFAIARRQWRVVALCVVVLLILAVGYVVTSVRLYTSQTSLLIDRSDSEIAAQLSNFGQLTDDEGTVLSQVELLRSEAIAGAVVDKLNLPEDPQFMAPGQSMFSMQSIKSLLLPQFLFAEKEVKAEDKRGARLGAIRTVIGSMAVERVGRTYVLNVRYTSQDPALSQKIASAIADAYLVDKLNSKYEATRRASDWMQARIDELKQKALESDLAVQKFRSENGLVQSSEGRLLSEQQLSESNTALSLAQKDTAEARARYDSLKRDLAEKGEDAIVTAQRDNPVANDLRKKYLDASKLESEISARLGKNHTQAVRLRNEMANYKRLMFGELNRLLEGYKADYDIAAAREKELLEKVQAATSVVATAGETEVQLRELERTAQSYRELYQNFLTRYQQAIQQQSFPITGARVITKADMPQGPSAPRKMVIMGLAGILGVVLGAGIAAAREFADKFIRNGDDVREMLGLEYLGVMPLVEAGPNDGQEKEPIDSTQPRSIARGTKAASYVKDHPLSKFAETLRSAKVAIDLGTSAPGGKVIGVISSLPGEGKSTTAINFAQLLAMQGVKSLLIDGDLRNPGATGALAPGASAGLLQAITDNAALRDILMMDPNTKLAFLPAVAPYRIAHSSQLLASPAMGGILEQLRERFDYVVVDLPPLGAVVDARAIAPRIDAFIFVVEWGRTSRKVIQSLLSADPELADKCAGVILTKVDTEKMRLYSDIGSQEYYYRRYQSYYEA